MAVTIQPDIIKDIADYLDMGMICYYHIPTGQVEYIPDELGPHVYDEEEWQETFDKIDKNRQEYIRFEAMSTHDSIGVLRAFVSSIPENSIRHRFEEAISERKAFQHFKHLLQDHPALEKKWFEFKTQKGVDWVVEQLEDYNSLES